MRVHIELKKEIDNSYQIDIGELAQIDLRDRKVAIITNPKVGGLWLGKVIPKIESRELYIITIRDGEEFKNMESVNYILENLFLHKFDRKSILIGLGGGVIGDITGWTASIYQRGIDFIQIPTTLLSQVDASVGGKTGINNRFGKNLIGAFHQPKHVYIDTNFLTTLPNREFGAGVAELVKMAVIFDFQFFKWLTQHDISSNSEYLKYAIKRSIELKAHVVSKDEKEAGIRASLNYGHTFGHVIENETNYSTYLHGEAVAIGMVMANRLAIRLGLLEEREAEEIEGLLKRYDLPTRYRISNIENFYSKFFLDKKSMDRKIKFVLPKGIGDFEFRDNIPENVIFSVLKEFQ
ncbi:MAG TPA: 3-dehydroquinate synthase [Campylobacterales bacterium]|nr:3-dehydroquinate synthase [Campylobacterales bacterium]